MQVSHTVWPQPWAAQNRSFLSAHISQDIVSRTNANASGNWRHDGHFHPAPDIPPRGKYGGGAESATTDSVTQIHVHIHADDANLCVCQYAEPLLWEMLLIILEHFPYTEVVVVGGGEKQQIICR
jgi:hypothetical protein